MKTFRFDREVGKEIEQFGSVRAIISKILHLDDEAVISSLYLQPQGRVGYHQAVTPQLFLIVQGEGWVRGEADQKFSIKAGQAAFWEMGEWHQSGTETGMTAVMIESASMDPAQFMPLI